MKRLSMVPPQLRGREIAEAVEVLRAGGIVAYPTDTLYGLAVDPRREDAVARLFRAKGRAPASAVALIAAALDQVCAAGELGPEHLRLAAAFWPGPLTMVVPAHSAIARSALGGGSTVGIRVPAHPVARALAYAHGYCITATSANRSGEPPASSADEVASAMATEIDLLLDAGPSPGGLPSTLIEWCAGEFVLRRAGAIAWDRVLKSRQ